MKTKVLHISKYYYPFSGGTEQIARDIVLSLNPDEYEQLVFCFDHKGPKDSEDYEDEVDGVQIYRCKCFTKVFSQSLSKSYGKRLKMVLDSFKPDIIIFHYPNPFAAHYLLKYLNSGTKLIVYWHLDIVKQKVLKYLFASQNKKLIKEAYRVVATSPLYVEYSPWLNKVKEKCVVIPNCIDEKRLTVNDKEKEIARNLRKKNAGKIMCMAVGRHVEYKGFKYLIEASKHLDDRFIINISGQGPLTGELKELATNDFKIHFLGLLSDEELIAYLSACDIFCFPSITKNEAFGLALAEGMFFGKPAVTFTIPGSGVNYVNLNQVTGIECNNGDSKAYAEAMVKLANDPNLRTKYGNAARQRVEQNFTFEQFKKNITSLLSKQEII